MNLRSFIPAASVLSSAPSADRQNLSDLVGDMRDAGDFTPSSLVRLERLLRRLQELGVDVDDEVAAVQRAQSGADA